MSWSEHRGSQMMTGIITIVSREHGLCKRRTINGVSSHQLADRVSCLGHVDGANGVLDIGRVPGIRPPGLRHYRSIVATISPDDPVNGHLSQPMIQIPMLSAPIPVDMRYLSRRSWASTWVEHYLSRSNTCNT